MDAHRVMKDHEIRTLVNQLTETASKFHGTEQLRERIAAVIVDPLKRLRDEVNCWREKGRGPMLHDAEMRPNIERLKKRLKEDPEFARQLLTNAGIVNKDGKITKAYGGEA